MGLFSDPSLFPLATLIIIAACGAAVLLGYAQYRLFYGIEDMSIPEPTDEQAAYMRDVRFRNVRDVAATLGRRYDVEVDRSERSGR